MSTAGAQERERSGGKYIPDSREECSWLCKVNSLMPLPKLINTHHRQRVAPPTLCYVDQRGVCPCMGTLLLSNHVARRVNCKFHCNLPSLLCDVVYSMSLYHIIVSLLVLHEGQDSRSCCMRLAARGVHSSIVQVMLALTLAHLSPSSISSPAISTLQLRFNTLSGHTPLWGVKGDGWALKGISYADRAVMQPVHGGIRPHHGLSCCIMHTVDR